VDLARFTPSYLSTGARIVHVDGARADSYAEDGSLIRPYKAIQDAVDSITDQAADKKYVVSAAPSVYPENVTTKRHVALCGASGFGISRETVIRTASGVALTVPYRECLVNGIQARSDSATPAHAAIRVYDDGGGAGDSETFVVNSQGLSTDGGDAVLVESNATGDTAIALYTSFDGGPSGRAVHIDGGGLIQFLGGIGGEKNGVLIENGGVALLGAEVGINCSDSDATAWALDVDGGFAILLGNTLGGYNGLRLSNGGIAILHDAANIGGFTGVPVQTAAGTVLALGNVALDQFGAAPWSTWSVAGITVILPTGTQGAGTTGVGGPDQRPTAAGNVPPISYKFFALDITLGGGTAGTWLTWNGAAWVDTGGTVRP